MPSWSLSPLIRASLMDVRAGSHRIWQATRPPGKLLGVSPRKDAVVLLQRMQHKRRLRAETLRHHLLSRAQGAVEHCARVKLQTSVLTAWRNALQASKRLLRKKLNVLSYKVATARATRGLLSACFTAWRDALRGAAPDASSTIAGQGQRPPPPPGLPPPQPRGQSPHLQAPPGFGPPPGLLSWSMSSRPPPGLEVWQ
jgi:hypothetical protein